jgi:hypothetical protein
MKELNIEQVADYVRRLRAALERIIPDLEAVWVLVSPYVGWFMSVLTGPPANT